MDESRPMSRPRCSATTRAGNPCRNYAFPGSDRCSHHRGHEWRPAGPLEWDPAVVEKALEVIRRYRSMVDSLD
jgi:hypothetical protein